MEEKEWLELREKWNTSIPEEAIDMAEIVRSWYSEKEKEEEREWGPSASFYTVRDWTARLYNEVLKPALTKERKEKKELTEKEKEAEPAYLGWLNWIELVAPYDVIVMVMKKEE